MQQLFDAVNISTIAANCQTLLIAFIGVALLFFGFRLIRKLIMMGTEPDPRDYTDDDPL